jgi:hypothetical protein
MVAAERRELLRGDASTRFPVLDIVALRSEEPPIDVVFKPGFKPALVVRSTLSSEAVTALLYRRSDFHAIEE